MPYSLSVMNPTSSCLPTEVAAMKTCVTLLALALAVTAVRAQADRGQSHVEQTPLDEQTAAVEPITDIPIVGFGTWNLDKSNASAAVVAALQHGYRHIDAATIYGNQQEVGRGIARGLEEYSIDRQDVWVTSKLWNDKHSPNDVSKALDQTLQELGLAYLDLYLMHWPVSSGNNSTKIDYLETWKAMTDLPRSKVRHVGIANFSPDQLRDVLHATPDRKPYAHQFEIHPYLPQSSWLDVHAKHGIHVTAYSPLGNSNPTYGDARRAASGSRVPHLLDNPLVQRIAVESNCTAAQVVLKWGILRRTSVIPKSQHADRIAENWASRHCELTEAAVRALSEQLPLRRFNNPSKSWGVKLFHGLDASGERLMETWTAWQGEMAGLLSDAVGLWRLIVSPLYSDGA